MTQNRTESLSLSLILVLFIALKLLGYIDWSWWWVLSPIWVPAFFIFGTIAVAFTVRFIIEMRK